eukprot:m.946854 g.946854  ORF g.946854 m.946854 type:complete len:60 (+) comp23847_c0_seq54:161-340(+)
MGFWFLFFAQSWNEQSQRYEIEEENPLAVSSANQVEEWSPPLLYLADVVQQMIFHDNSH